MTWLDRLELWVGAWLGRWVEQPDKVLHFLVGAALAGGLAALDAPQLAVLWAVGVVAWGKEAWDKAHPPHDADGWDAFATAAGGLAALSVFALL